MNLRSAFTLAYHRRRARKWMWPCRRVSNQVRFFSTGQEFRKERSEEEGKCGKCQQNEQIHLSTQARLEGGRRFLEMFARQLDMFFDRRIHTAGASVDVEISLQVAASSRATLINQCGKKRAVKKECRTIPRHSVLPRARTK